MVPMRRDVDAATVARHYGEGRSLRWIAATMGCSLTLVWNRLADAGVSRRRPGRERKLALYREAADAYAAGEGVASIAARAGCCGRTVLRRARLGGAAMRPRGRPRESRCITIAMGRGGRAPAQEGSG